MGQAIDAYRAFILSNQFILLTLIFLCAIAAAVFFTIGSLRLRALHYLYASARARKDLAALDAILLHQAEVQERLDERVTALEGETTRARNAARKHLQHCVLERFQAFKDTGGDQSFSLALLDANDDGVVLTSIYGRNESHIFAKRIASGSSKYALSEEEQKVLAVARAESDRQKDIPAETAKM